MDLLSFRQLRPAVLFFFVFFTICAIAQYVFVKTQTEQASNEDRRSDAKELNEAIAYDGGIDDESYAKVQLDLTNYIVILNDGSILDLSIDISGLPRSLLPPVVCPVLSEAIFKKPTTLVFRNAAAKKPESWRLLARKLDRGYVIIGVSEYDNSSLSDDRMQANLDRLGATLDSANHVAAKSLDNGISWLLVDERGELINGYGRIPLNTNPMQIGRESKDSPYRTIGDKEYYFTFAPITDKAGKQVGTIVLFDDVTNWKTALNNQAKFGIGIAVLSMAVFLALSFFSYTKHEKEKQEIREAFQNYFSPQILEAILREPEQLKEKRREVTVLFSDIRSFTSIAERLPPHQLTRILQEYFDEMADAVLATEGIVDKYIGDAVMAFWGAPIEQADQADRAVRAAMDMTKRLKKLQEKWLSEGLPVLDIGIGINLGIATVGNFGSAKRFDYTVIGDTVNAASRIESLNKEHKSHIIISESTKDQLTFPIKTRDLGDVLVKGKEKPIRIYEVLTDLAQANL